MSISHQCINFGDKEGKRQCGFCKAWTINVPVDDEGHPLKDKSNQLIALPAQPRGPHQEFHVHLPPNKPGRNRISLFAAGSIEMGAAVLWQDCLIKHLEHLPIMISNPRRHYWDPAVNVKSVNVKFREQVKWEMDALDQATVICFFLDINTISPVTMMEIGLWIGSGKSIVCCSDEFWRSGNVKIMCDRYNVPRVDSFENLVPAVQEFLKRKGMKLDEHGNLKDGPLQPALEMAEGEQWWLRFRDPEKLKAENEAKKDYANYKAAKEAEEAKEAKEAK